MKCALALVLVAHLGASSEGVKLFTDGAAHLQEGRWLEAEKTLARAAVELDDHPDVHALLGIARYHLGRYARARTSLDLALERGTRYEARALYYLGMTLSKLGAEDRAAGVFSRLLEEHPNSAEARRVDPDRKLKRGPATPRALAVVLLQSLSYDDNAVRSSELQRSGPTDGDSVSFTLASLNGALGQQFKWHTILFGKDYATLNEQDLVSASAGLTWNAGGGPVEISYRHRRQWLDGKRFDARDIAGLGYSSDRSREWRVGINAEYATTEHDEPYDVLDGYVSGLAVHLERKHDADSRAPSGALWLSVNDNRCEAEYLGYDVRVAGIRSRFELTDKASLGVALSYGRRTHHDIDPIGEVRMDDRWNLKIDVGFPLGASSAVTGKVWGTSIDNSSTLSEYDYIQHVWGIEVAAVF